MTEQFTHETYLSPFTWRYGSDEMRKIWSLAYQRRLWRDIWIALAQAQQVAGLVTQEQVDDLRVHRDDIDIEQAHAYEAELKHDLMAEVRTYADQCKIGGGIIHLGATSMDIEDNADALRLRDATGLIVSKLQALLHRLRELIEREADHVCMGFTHVQPAEPTTIGYRLAFIAQDLLADYVVLQRVCDGIRGKGIKGAVGTAASYSDLLQNSNMTPRQLEQSIMQSLNLKAFEISHQTYTRRQDYEVLNALSTVALSVHKFAFDLRLLQSPPLGEWAEPFGSKQVGSSAMPFKRNPINAENINSLARYVAALPRVAWDNAANSLLERTLDDSANRRVILPQAFLATDELLRRMQRLLDGLQINRVAIKRNLDTYGVFAATERVMMEAVRQGGDRQVLHEVIREHSLAAWGVMQQGDANPLADLLAADDRITQYIPAEQIHELLQADQHIGDAPERARNLAAQIQDLLG